MMKINFEKQKIVILPKAPMTLPMTQPLYSGHLAITVIRTVKYCDRYLELLLYLNA